MLDPARQLFGFGARLHRQETHFRADQRGVSDRANPSLRQYEARGPMSRALAIRMLAAEGAGQKKLFDVLVAHLHF